MSAHASTFYDGRDDWIVRQAREQPSAKCADFPGAPESNREVESKQP
jgi:hypothetical protein